MKVVPPLLIAKADGVDYVPMKTGKNSMIQLLNIAGVGPIFGPIMGALYGPVAFLWIVLGAIFAGAVHDYLTGMISIRNGGAHLPELAGRFLGKTMKHVVNAFSILLLVLVGTVFVTAPASLDCESDTWHGFHLVSSLQRSSFTILSQRYCRSIKSLVKCIRCSGHCF